MSRRLIDLSVAIQNGIASDPPHSLPKIEYRDHSWGMKEFQMLFPGLEPEQVLEGKGPAIEQVEFSTHNGTHMDAPWHFHPTMNNGERAITIDEVPLEWCLGHGVKFDFRDKPDGYVCTPDDVDAELERIGYELQPLDIVLINTAAGAAYGQDDFLQKGCGMGREATLHLLRKGVRVAGTDGWSWDAPFSYTRAKFEKTGDASIIWEGHKAGAELGYCHIEKLTNLDQLPDHGFTISCFPVKMHKTSAGWVRAVAILDA